MSDRTSSQGRLRTALRWTLALVYLIAGVLHLRSPQGFLQITPSWVPYPELVIAATGVCEIFGAVGLMTRRFRWWAGVMLAAYAVCVFPANIRHAVDGIAVGGVRLGLWYHIPRLLFQPVLIWWALFCSGVIDWPTRALPNK